MARHFGYLWRCLVGLFCLSVQPSFAVTCYSYQAKYYSTFEIAGNEAAKKNCGVLGRTPYDIVFYPNHPYSPSVEYKCTGVGTTQSAEISSVSRASCTDDPLVCTPDAVLGTGSTRWVYQGNYPGLTWEGGGYCISGCKYDLYGWEGYDKQSNMSAARGYMKGSGQSCSPTNPPKTDDPGVPGATSDSSPSPSACKVGDVPYTGTVNGKTVTVCGAPSKTSGTQTETTTNSSSTTTNNNGTQTTSTTNTGDSKTTKTTCENGTCTTTTTSSSSSGGGSGTSGGSSSSGTQTKTESQESFCKANPQALVCKQQDESSFGGSCGAFSCSGDAVQCAQARAAHDLLCEVKLSDTDPNVMAGKAAASGVLVPGDHPGANGQTQAFALSSMLDSTPLFGTSGDCIADKTVPMLGQTLTLPFSRMCGALELLGNAFLAACFLAAGMIVFRT